MIREAATGLYVGGVLAGLLAWLRRRWRGR
jgi:hypothetical protein